MAKKKITSVELTDAILAIYDVTERQATVEDCVYMYRTQSIDDVMYIFAKVRGAIPRVTISDAIKIYELYKSSEAHA